MKIISTPFVVAISLIVILIPLGYFVPVKTELISPFDIYAKQPDAPYSFPVCPDVAIPDSMLIKSVRKNMLEDTERIILESNPCDLANEITVKTYIISF